MNTFKDRLIIEKSELNEKITKLSDFLQGDVFLTIDPRQQSLLKIQFNSMITYHQCLEERINIL